MEDFKLRDYIEKLKSLDEDDKLKMVYQWVKQNVINLEQFKKLISYC